ncbi:hypothetical protein [Congregibacter sp.]|uniref:hypothetical protein n=1 Tax=Congregibacter sp. TaxID=2744308 RepID=UPI003F6B7597
MKYSGSADNAGTLNDNASNAVQTGQIPEPKLAFRPEMVVTLPQCAQRHAYALHSESVSNTYQNFNQCHCATVSARAAEHSTPNVG